MNYQQSASGLLLSSLMVLGIGGCAVGAEDEFYDASSDAPGTLDSPGNDSSEGSEAEPPSEELDYSIYGGQTTELDKFLPSVHLNIVGKGQLGARTLPLATGCSGVIIGAGIIMTANHCLPADDWYEVSVTGRYSGDNYCLTGNIDGQKNACAPGVYPYDVSYNHNDTMFMYGYKFSGCLSNDGTEVCSGKDIAILKLWTNQATDFRRMHAAQGTTARARLTRTGTSEGTSYTIYGWGNELFSSWTTPKKKRATFEVQSVYTDFFRTNANLSDATCKGDSGSPWVLRTGSFPKVTGIHSNGQHEGRCVPSGGKQHATRVSDKQTWIKSVVASTGVYANAPYPQQVPRATCVNVAADTDGVLSLQCW
jgi:hypothetical protein